jgi:hypothetical protein
MTYQLTSGDTIVRLSDNAYIPQAPENQKYLITKLQIPENS